MSCKLCFKLQQKKEVFNGSGPGGVGRAGLEAGLDTRLLRTEKDLYDLRGMVFELSYYNRWRETSISTLEASPTMTVSHKQSIMHTHYRYDPSSLDPSTSSNKGERLC